MWQRRPLQFWLQSSTLTKWKHRTITITWFQYQLSQVSYCKLSVYSYFTDLLTWFSSTIGLYTWLSSNLLCPIVPVISELFKFIVLFQLSSSHLLHHSSYLIHCVVLVVPYPSPPPPLCNLVSMIPMDNALCWCTIVVVSPTSLLHW